MVPSGRGPPGVELRRETGSQRQTAHALFTYLFLSGSHAFPLIAAHALAILTRSSANLVANRRNPRLSEKRGPTAMICSTAIRRRNRTRGGTTVVETAIVLPVFLLFILTIIEFGHAMMIRNVLSNSCRTGARIGSTTGVTSAQVKDAVKQQLASVVPTGVVTVYVKDASAYDSGSTPPTSDAAIEALPDLELTAAAERQLYLVRAKVSYHNVAIIPHIPILGSFLDSIVIDGDAFMRHE